MAQTDLGPGYNSAAARFTLNSNRFGLLCPFRPLPAVSLHPDLQLITVVVLHLPQDLQEAAAALLRNGIGGRTLQQGQVVGMRKYPGVT